MKRLAISLAGVFLTLLSLPAQQNSIDDFFRDFTDEWVRGNPNQATSARYFTGEEQDRLERQLTPETRAYRESRIQLARKGLAGLAKFDRSRMTDAQRLSADVMRWQLEIAAAEEPYLDYSFPLQQMNGVNINVVEAMTVRHPLANEKDATNYIAALGQVSARMDEAIAESRRLAAENVVPPKFILQATIKQMQSFADPAPAQNPFVAVFTQKMEAAKIPEARRAELKSQAEKIVAAQVYPAWKRGIALLESQLPRSNDDAGLWRLKGGPEAYAYFLRRFTTTDLTAGPDPRNRPEGGRPHRRRNGRDLAASGPHRRLGQRSRRETEAGPRLSPNRSRPRAHHEGCRGHPPRRRETLRAAVRQDSQVARGRPAVSALSRGQRRRQLQRTRTGRLAPRRLPNPAASGPHDQVRLCAAWSITKPFPAIIFKSRWKSRITISRASVRSARWAASPLSLRAGACTPSAWPPNPAGMKATWKASSASSTRLCSAPAAWWSIPAFTPNIGPASKLSITASSPARWSVTWCYPGQACSYMIGQLKIVELREKARQALGSRFSLRQFHNVVFETGSVPLDILERQVEAYERSAR